MKSQRVDDFYENIFLKRKGYKDLPFVTKKVLILLHGNGQVESGFSINEDLLNENMKQELIFAQWVVYDGVMQEGGILKVNDSKEMMTEVWSLDQDISLLYKRKRKTKSWKKIS